MYMVLNGKLIYEYSDKEVFKYFGGSDGYGYVTRYYPTGVKCEVVYM